MHNIFYTWNEAIQNSYDLAEKVQASGFLPDRVVGIIRGGVITGTIISYFLENSVPFFCVYLLMSGIVIARHKTNMKNIRTGNERKIGEKENNKEQT